MEVVLRLLSELRLVLVAIAGICCAAFLFTGLSSLRELRRAVFRLERSAIFSRAINSWLKAGLCAIVGMTIWVTSGITPAAPSNLASNPLSMTPTAAISTEPTPLPTADLSNAALQMTAVPTDVAAAQQPFAQPATIDPNLAAAPVALPAPGLTQTPPPAAALGSPTPEPPPAPTSLPAASDTLPPARQAAEALGSDCPNPAARIYSPGDGETISGNYVVLGTADFPGGAGRYKIEILRPNIQGWAFLWENHNVIKEGVLMPKFDSSLFPPGVYTLRLSLVDGAGQETGIYCSVQIRIA